MEPSISKYLHYTIHTFTKKYGEEESRAFIESEPMFGTFSQLDKKNSLEKMIDKIDAFERFLNGREVTEKLRMQFVREYLLLKK